MDSQDTRLVGTTADSPDGRGYLLFEGKELLKLTLPDKMWINLINNNQPFLSYYLEGGGTAGTTLSWGMSLTEFVQHLQWIVAKQGEQDGAGRTCLIASNLLSAYKAGEIKDLSPEPGQHPLESDSFLGQLWREALRERKPEEKKRNQPRGCDDCGKQMGVIVDRSKQPELVEFAPYLKKEIWKSLDKPGEEPAYIYLCWFCTEKRLGRRLVIKDLDGYPHYKQ